MQMYARLLPALLFCSFANGLFAQNIAISYQNPTGLFVCGTGNVAVTLQNTAVAAVNDLLVSVSMPVGIQYEPGSVVGATESNIVNLNAPVFATANLAPGAALTFSLGARAGCGLIEAINSGQQFANAIAVSYAGGSQQLTTDFYLVETGLLFITDAAPFSQSGKKGDVLTRTVSLRNTRQGPISGLRFSDEHEPGIEISLSGISGQHSPTLFEADVPGSYFTAYGDGDNLLEFNEVVTLTEQILITDCGTPSDINHSLIRAAWGCGAAVCQSDSATASVTILPAGTNPALQFISTYTPQLSWCGSEPAVQEFLVVNTGATTAENLQVTLVSDDGARLALDANSFQLNTGNGWSSLPSDGGQQTILEACNIDVYKLTSAISLPPLAPGDTVRVRFDTYFCAEPCSKENVAIQGLYNYNKTCPEGELASGTFTFLSDSNRTKIASKIYFDIGVCLEENELYNFAYWVKSARLPQHNGYLNLHLKLPWGLFWDNSCVPTLDGKTPVAIAVDTVSNVHTVLKMSFLLPMTQDSVFGEFCLRNICQPPFAYEPSIPSLPPSQLDFTIYPVEPPCSPCRRTVESVTFLSTTLSTSAECGISTCDAYELVLNCGCDDPSCVGGGNGALLVAEYDSWRLNLGLRDNNDDRNADNNSIANAPLLRRDRFLPGDTMRTQLRGVLQSGDLAQVSFRIFNENWLSDFGIDGGNSYKIELGKSVFTNASLLRYLNGMVTLKIAATGQQYTCPIGAAAAISDQHYVKIAVPNIRPEVIIDEMTSMFHQFTVDIPLLSTLGCVPAGLLLQPGDSVIFTGDFKFEQNFTPQSENDPPLVNFRNTVCGTRNIVAWHLTGCYPPLLRQYSGYKEELILPVYRIEPCGVSTELSPFQYSLRIARENLFPYEVRPLARVFDFRHSFPAGLSLLEARLKFLNLQESAPVFSDQLLQTNLSSGFIHLDFQPFFNKPLDEGFLMEANMQFTPDCAFKGPKISSTSVSMGYFSNGFHKPNPFTAQVSNPSGWLAGQPKLSLVPEDTIIAIAGNKLEVELALLNNIGSPAPNAWVSWETTGDFSGVALLLLPQQQPLPVAAGVFQLGEIQAFSKLNLVLKGQLKVCEPVFIKFRYGWDCAPVSNPDGNPCGYFEKTIEIRPLAPELEMLVLVQPDAVPMCAPSTFFEFEVYNAAEGIAFGVLGSVKLPIGLTVVPGSSQLSYPAGTAFVNLANPVTSPGNVYQWLPENTSAILAQNGLQDIDQEPENALRIRFRVQAECGFVANSQPIYGTEAFLPCGLASNVLRKPGDPVQLEGFGPSYDVSASLAYTEVQDGSACGEAANLTAKITFDGAPNPGDSIYVVLPDGVSYVNGSYQQGPNSPAGAPQVSGSVLQWPLPAGLADGATLQFSFGVRFDDAAVCVDKAVLLQVREKVSVFCPIIGQNCAAYIATGEALLFLKIKNPDLILQNIETTLNNNQLTIFANLANAGAGTAANAVVQFYLDQNGNGKVDANEPLVATLSPGQPLSPGATVPLLGSLDLPPSSLCQLLAFIPASSNCACADKTFRLQQEPIVTAVTGVCELMPVPLGVDSVAGNTYTWLTANGLSCTGCAQTTFTPDNTVQPGGAVTLVLEEKTTGCTIEYRFEVRFGGELSLETPNQFVCAGEAVQLEATPGGTYQWDGPNLANPAAPVQIVRPDQTSTYSVTITFAGGCTGTGQSVVTVYPKDSIDLGNIVTCPGNPVNIFGTLTDQPGFYTQALQNTNGCDSISFLRLVVFPLETFETRPVCPGDSIVVFDSVFTKNGSICRSFTSSADCDSTHCVAVEFLPKLNLPVVQDSFVISAGQQVSLDGPDGFAAYIWTPAEGLSCNTCPDPVASPKVSTLYLLTVTDDNGCNAAATYRVLQCDFEALVVPNAFTPNADGVNDAFRIVPLENIAEVQTLAIYNRWGQKVWQGTGKNAQWDGTFGGKPAPSDVYVWILTGGCGGEAKQRKGDVGLLR